MISCFQHASYIFNTHYSQYMATKIKMFSYIPPKVILCTKTTYFIQHFRNHKLLKPFHRIPTVWSLFPHLTNGDNDNCFTWFYLPGLSWPLLLWLYGTILLFFSPHSPFNHMQHFGIFMINRWT